MKLIKNNLFQIFLKVILYGYINPVKLKVCYYDLKLYGYINPVEFKVCCYDSEIQVSSW